jgi:hypothetical protein
MVRNEGSGTWLGWGWVGGRLGIKTLWEAVWTLSLPLPVMKDHRRLLNEVCHDAFWFL